MAAFSLVLVLAPIGIVALVLACLPLWWPRARAMVLGTLTAACVAVLAIQPVAHWSWWIIAVGGALVVAVIRLAILVGTTTSPSHAG